MVPTLAELETMFLLESLLRCWYSFTSQFEYTKFADTFIILTVFIYRAAIKIKIIFLYHSHGYHQEKQEFFQPLSRLDWNAWFSNCFLYSICSEIHNSLTFASQKLICTSILFPWSFLVMICLCDDRTVWHTVLCLALSLLFFFFKQAHSLHVIFFLEK